MKSLRIGIEAQRIFRKKKGGMDVVAIELIRNLAELDRTNEYFIFAKPGEEPLWDLPSNFHWVIQGKLPYPIWEQLYLPFAAKKYKLDLLHCTSNTAPIFPGTQLFLTLHDIIFLENLRFMKGNVYQRFGNLYRKFIVPAVVGKCKQIFTVSETEKINILGHLKSLDKNRVEVVYNGVNHAFYSDATLQQSDVKSIYELPDNYAFFLGNTDPKKNMVNVLKALLEVKHKYGVTVNLAVTNYTPENLDILLEKNGIQEVKSQVKLTGYVDKQHMPALYKQASFYLYPSLREGFGLPILEAQICETLVITSNCSCMPEVAGDGAFFCDPFNIESIAAAIFTAQKNELSAMAVQNGKANTERFSWGKMAGQIHSAYSAAAKVS